MAGTHVVSHGQTGSPLGNDKRQLIAHLSPRFHAAGGHPCLRCGLESRCLHGSWADRHPAAAVAAGVPSVLFTLAAVGAYPLVLIPLIVVAAVVWLDRRQRRRAALAARADWEHRAVLAAAMPALAAPAPRRRGRPRGADHWSPTQPIRSGR